MTTSAQNPRRACRLQALFVSVLLACSAAQAQLVNVDFNSATSATYTGAGVVGAAGDVWNGVVVPNTALSNIALKDSTGASTSITLASSAAGFGFSSAETNCSLAAALACDYLVANNRTITFSFSGLTAAEPYELVLYAIPLATGRTITFRSGGVTKTAALPPGVGPSGITSFVENQSYVRYSGTVGQSGVLSFDLVGGSFASEGDLNGFQLQVGPVGAVPEPAAVALMLVGLVALGTRVRRLRG